MLKLLGVPYDQNSSFKQGSALAPERMRLMDIEGSSNRFCEHGIEIKPDKNYEDLGDILFHTDEPEAVYRQIRQSIKDHLSLEDKIISIGGDHSISYPIIEAYSEIYNDLHVLHLDAHADIYENFKDNPYSHASPFARLLEKDVLKSLTQVGIRTLTIHQKSQIEKYKVKVVEMKNFNFDFLNTLKGPLYISLDIDVLDPAFAPGISHHEPGGMTTRQLINIINHIKVPIVGADIVEVNPKRDINDMTAMVAYKLFKELASKMI
ncbi:MAG: agmatinase [Flavobacteriaceae bacterium]|nr:agmatinase [Flavobacteriaceae bacterium]